MNKTELEIHKAESGEEGLLITINVFVLIIKSEISILFRLQGWVGSGGKGTIVLDDLVVKQISEAQEDSEATTTVKTSDVMDVSNKTAVKQSCVLDKDQGDCSANFTRYYYSLTTDACLKVR